MAGKDAERIEYGMMNAKDWDALIPVPYHCLVRLMNWVSFTNGARPDTAFARDVQIVRECVNNELKRTKNFQ